MFKKTFYLSLVLLFLISATTAFSQEFFNLQVAALTTAQDAQTEITRLTEKGIPAFTKIEAVNGITFHKVYIGPFESNGEAQAAGNHLKTNNTISEFLVKKEVTETANTETPQIPVINDTLPQTQQPTYGEALPSDYPPATVAETGAVAGAEVNNNSELVELLNPDGTTQLMPRQEAEKMLTPQTTAVTTGNPQIPVIGESLPQTQQPTYGEALPSNYPPATVAGTGAEINNTSELIEVLNPDGSTQLMPRQEAEKMLAPQTTAVTTGNPQIPVIGESLPQTQQPTYGEALPNNYPPATVAGTGAISSEATTATINNKGQNDNQGNPPTTPKGPMKIDAFNAVVDLSSSMGNLSTCQGKVKDEAVSALLRKMNHRIPGHPYQAALTVFGYKKALTRKDYITDFYNLSTYNRKDFEQAIAKLSSAPTISPFGWALKASADNIGPIPGKRAILMFADFEETTDSGAPVDTVSNLKRRFGTDFKVYTFYITRQKAAEKLAENISKKGEGNSYNVCTMLNDEEAFENMMMEIFGPADEVGCFDNDADGVCNEDDKCPNTPLNAPVDSRGCWIAAYSQFFDFDKDKVKTAFIPRLKHAAEIMNSNPQLGNITITGHTDSKGADEYNLKLGARRAEAIKLILIENGVSATRLTVESFGKTQPIAENDTEEGRAKNRRVEFNIKDVAVTQ